MMYIYIYIPISQLVLEAPEQLQLFASLNMPKRNFMLPAFITLFWSCCIFSSGRKVIYFYVGGTLADIFESFRER